jgi:hypothetical protein
MLYMRTPSSHTHTRMRCIRVCVAYADVCCTCGRLARTHTCVCGEAAANLAPHTCSTRAAYVQHTSAYVTHTHMRRSSSRSCTAYVQHTCSIRQHTSHTHICGEAGAVRAYCCFTAALLLLYCWKHSYVAQQQQLELESACSTSASKKSTTC